MAQGHHAPLVELKNAGLHRAHKWIVRNIDLSIHPGEIVTLIGPNGSGKTSTVKMALGIEKPDEGDTILKKDSVVGYVPQKISIDWTVPLNCDRLMRLTSNLTEREIEDALEMTGISPLRHESVHSLSGGEFQRLLLARAIARKPDLLVLDEPIQGVDHKGEIALYELITKVRNTLNCAVLMISHDLHIVMAATDRVLCLNGHICCQGSPSNVVQTEAFKDLFGYRSDTLAIYQHHHDHDHHMDGKVIETTKDQTHAG